MSQIKPPGSEHKLDIRHLVVLNYCCWFLLASFGLIAGDDRHGRWWGSGLPSVFGGTAKALEHVNLTRGQHPRVFASILLRHTAYRGYYRAV